MGVLVNNCGGLSRFSRIDRSDERDGGLPGKYAHKLGQRPQAAAMRMIGGALAELLVFVFVLSL